VPEVKRLSCQKLYFFLIQLLAKSPPNKAGGSVKITDIQLWTIGYATFRRQGFHLFTPVGDEIPAAELTRWMLGRDWSTPPREGTHF